jgi:hypothetical protein
VPIIGLWRRRRFVKPCTVPIIGLSRNEAKTQKDRSLIFPNRMAAAFLKML